MEIIGNILLIIYYINFVKYNIPNIHDYINSIRLLSVVTEYK